MHAFTLHHRPHLIFIFMMCLHGYVGVARFLHISLEHHEALVVRQVATIHLEVIGCTAVGVPFQLHGIVHLRRPD